ncbi:MAG: YcxB family protein [Anaerotruncus massiliensis (ex Togo et al. 2019)]
MEPTAESARFAARMKQDDRMYRQLIRFHHKYLTHLFYADVGVVALLAFLMTLAEVLRRGAAASGWSSRPAGPALSFAPEWSPPCRCAPPAKPVSGMLETDGSGDRWRETDQTAELLSQFVKAFETREGYYLYIARQQAYVLGRDGFTRGDPEEFRAFFEAAAGRPVKWKGPR